MRALLVLLQLLTTLLQTQPTARHTPHWYPLGYAYITGYTWTGARTASGRWPTLHHTAAADPGYLPRYAWVRVAGLGVYQIEDTGGFRGAHIDLYVASDPEAYHITGDRRVWVAR